MRGWWLSEKLDGWRAAWIAEKRHFVLRGGASVEVPDWFADLMPSVDTDGELWAGRGNRSIVASLMGNRPRWDKIRFCYFGKMQEETFSETQIWAHMANSHLLTVPQFEVEDWRDIAEHFASVVSQGGEGVVIRDPYEIVRPGRSDRVLKIKPPPFCEGDPTKWTATKANEFLKLANAR